ncbi:MAG: DAK2 domain-containing protein [Acidimicrobiales bacterium]
MTSLDTLRVDDVVRALSVFRDLLVAHKAAINALNVYPVPDGDTGTNMSLTLESVIAEIDGAPADAAAKWKAISHGSLMGARGNSGVILSQVLRGLSDRLSTDDEIDATTLADALRQASVAADGAVLRPVEGTILTVVRDTATEAVASADAGAGMVEVLDRSLVAGKASLERTPELLPVLADAGVVDAGGAGFLLFVDALLHVVDQRELPPPPEIDPDTAIAEHGHGGGHGVDTGDVGDLRYEVMFFLDAADDRIDEFKAAWGEVGDSIVVVGGDGLWNCHIHSNDIGASIEAAIAVGRPHQIRVTDLFEQVEHLENVMPPGEDALVQITNPEPATTAVVAVAVGHGVQQIFESLGVHAVIRGGQSMNPSTRQLVQAVEQVDAQQVVILPNNKNIIPVAQQVDGEVDKSVVVVGTRGIAEGFASLLAYDPGADAETNAAAMGEAAAAVVAGEVTCAVRDADTEAGAVQVGDWIGLDRHGVRSIGSDIVAATTALLDQLVDDDHELVTVIAGADADADTDDAVVAWLSEHRPDVDVELHQGGQPLYPYYIGIE